MTADRPATASATATSAASQRVRTARTTARALPEWLAKMVDFESWAPRSSRMWRLDQYNYERSTSSSDEEVEREAALAGLQARVDALKKEQRRGQKQPAGVDAEDEDDVPSTSGNGGAGAGAGGVSDDIPLTAAAIARAAGAEQQQQEDEEEEVPPLSADEIRFLLLKKWGKQYDMAFVRRDLPGMKPFCALNVYPNSLEQRSFILTEEQYVDKMAAIALRLHVLGQTDRVRRFLEAPAKSSKGLPRRPTMGTAVSIPLEVTPAQVEAYFTGPI